MSDDDSKRHDRLDEMISELRLALPGVQVLFAFLLTVPFTQRWGQVDAFQQDVYLLAFLSAAVASTLLIAPSAIARWLHEEDDKTFVMWLGTRLALLGLASLGVAITAVALLVVDVILSRAAATATAIVIGGLIVTVWFAVPLVRLWTTRWR